jgi:hypothetical protein
VVAFVPRELACDWSYPAISTIDSASDARAAIVCAYVCAWAAALRAHAWRKTSVGALVCLLWGVLPFFLASNVLIGVGTSKAERVLYLPSLGACMAIALGLQRADARGALAPAPLARARRPGRAPSALAWAAGLAVFGAYSAQCVWYADVWRTGVGLWENAVRVQQARPAWTRSGVTTHSIGEYGLQLSWASRNIEAQAQLEEQLRMGEEERLGALHGTITAAGGAAHNDEIEMGGYGPLALVYRMNGDPFKALACAEKAIQIFELARAAGGAERKKRELGMVLAARALALWIVRPESAVGEMQKAIMLSNGQDTVVNALVEQLFEGMRKRGIDPARLFANESAEIEKVYALNGRRAPGAAADGAAGPLRLAQPTMGAQAGPATTPMELAQLAQSPEVMQLLREPRVQHVLQLLETDPMSAVQFKDDPMIQQLLRLVQPGAAGTPGAQAPPPQQAAMPAKLPETLADFGAWAADGSQLVSGGGGGGAAAAARQVDGAPDTAGSVREWIAQADAEHAHAVAGAVPLTPVARGADGAAPELGGLPAYAVGDFSGDIMETKRPARAVETLAAPAAARPLDERATLVLRPDEPCEARDEALAAFRQAGLIANGGDVANAMPSYCKAVRLFVSCASHQITCAVGVADAFFIKLRLHAALLGQEQAAVREATCVALAGLRIYPLLLQRLKDSGNVDALSYVAGIAQNANDLFERVFATLPPVLDCAPVEATCGSDMQLLEQLGGV